MKMNLKTIITLAVLSAIAYVLMIVGRIPTGLLFLKYDPKDVIIIIGGFLFGPLAAVMMSLVVSFVEMFTVSDTGIWGFLMNVISSCTFACTASIIYKRKHTFFGAVIGLVCGWLLTTGVMILWNYLITPIYMDVPREVIVGYLLPAFLPFNLIKGGLNASITMLIYKPLSKALKKANLMPETSVQQNPQNVGVKKWVNIGTMLVCLFIIATGVLLILVFRGII